MWHYPVFNGDEDKSMAGAFLFEIQNRLIPNISYTIDDKAVQKYMFSPLSRLYLSPSDLKETWQMIERGQYGVTSENYQRAIGAVFRYKVLTGEISLSLFDKPITINEIRTFWKDIYSYQEGLEQVLSYMQIHNIYPNYTSYIKLWHDFVLQEIEKPYSLEALGWLVRSFLAYDKWVNNKLEKDYKQLMWQYAQYANLVVIRNYNEVPWIDTWKEGLDEYNQMRGFNL